MTGRDWWDDLYGPDEQHPADDQPAGEQRRWLTVRRTPAPEPEVEQHPGVHVTIRPTTPAQQPSPRKARIRWWVLRRGTAGLAGYYLTGLGPLTQSLLTDAGPGAIGCGLFLWAGAWRIGTLALRLVPRDASPEVHDGADWAAHIPSATILIALAFHTPGAIQ
ncbi:hypothetical protein ACFVZH_22500 [Streptomyces sp. NPDC059534]|uniref:hypothetical protein n=1 Tax=Streptomyces sp. NPDC059534 TaxID=3346859 RepID=UPI00369D0415